MPIPSDLRPTISLRNGFLVAFVACLATAESLRQCGPNIAECPQQLQLMAMRAVIHGERQVLRSGAATSEYKIQVSKWWHPGTENQWNWRPGIKSFEATMAVCYVICHSLIMDRLTFQYLRESVSWCFMSFVRVFSRYVIGVCCSFSFLGLKTAQPYQ